jgi:hypothetical protein
MKHKLGEKGAIVENTVTWELENIFQEAGQKKINSRLQSKWLDFHRKHVFRENLLSQ